MAEQILISGIYRDPFDVPLPDVNLIITSQANTSDTFRQLTVSQKTGTDGSYAFSLLPGGYDVTAVYPQGKREQLGDFTLEAGSPPGSLNDYLLYGESVLADPVVYSDIKKIHKQVGEYANEAAGGVNVATEAAERAEAGANEAGVQVYLAAQRAEESRVAKESAELAVTAAAEQVERAKGEVASAQSASAESLAARNEALAARDAAQTASVTAGIMPDVETGLANTSNGQSFSVAQGVGAETAIVTYINNNGVAIETSRLAGQALVDRISEDIKTVSQNNAQVVNDYPGIAEMTVDSAGGVTSRRLEDGTTQFPAVLIGQHVEMVQTSAGLVIQSRGDEREIMNISNDSTIKMSGYTVMMSDDYPDYAEIYADENGRVYKRVRLDGTVEQIAEEGPEIPNLSTYPLSYSDNGNIFASSNSGVNQVTSDTGASNVSPASFESYVRYLSNHSGAFAVQRSTYDGNGRVTENKQKLIHVLATGQSLSVGGATVAQVPFTITPDNDYSGITFNCGPKVDFRYDTLDPETDLQYFIPAQENSGKRPNQESPGSGVAYQIHALTGHSVLISVAGASGTAIADISEGTPTFAGAVGMIQRGYELASELGMQYQLHLVLTHGNQDAAGATNYATYKSRMTALRQSYQAAYQQITGRTDSLKMFVSQFANTRPNGGATGAATANAIGRAQYEVCRDDENFIFSDTQYARPYVDNDHLSSEGYRTDGELVGMAIGRYINDGEFTGLMPVEAGVTVSNGVITIPVAGCVGKLVIDTDRVTDPGNYGFVLGGNATITDVNVSGEDEAASVIISYTGTPDSVRYAIDGKVGDKPGPETGSRGCIHDSRPGFSKSGLSLCNDLIVFVFSL